MAPAVAWDDGRLHAVGLGQIGIELSDAEYKAQERGRRARRRLGKRCPVCLDPIDDGSTTCSYCAFEWGRVRSSARRLAEWVAAAAGESGLSHTVVWRAPDGLV